MAAMEMKIAFDPEAKAAIEALTDQVKALRDLLETKAGVEHHYHFQGNLDQKELDRLSRTRATWHG